MKIDATPPTSDARRDRVEREVFSQLAAMRAVDRADALAPPRRRWFAYAAASAFAAAAVIALVLLRPGEHRVELPSAPSLVVTPAGGSSRFTVGDAIVDAGSDTSVRVEHDADGGITLVLARGSVDCDVAPRNGRPPFRVLAGSFSVEVVGTRFTVHHDPARVDVTRGKVKVTSAGSTTYVTAGETWTASPQTADLQPTPEPSAASREPSAASREPDAASRPPQAAPAAAAVAVPPKRSSQDLFKSATLLESSDPSAAAKQYRSIANGTDEWAAPALYSLAELHANNSSSAALHDLDELARRFPRNSNAEDAAWLRVDILRKAGRTDAALDAIAAYLKTYPSGTYADAAARLRTELRAHAP